MAPPLRLPHVMALLGGIGPLLGLALVVAMPWYLLPLGAAMGLAAWGTALLLRPAVPRWNLAAWPSYSALPALLLFAATLSLRSFVMEPLWLLGFGWMLTLGVLGTWLLATHHLLSSTWNRVGAGSQFLNLAAYLTVFLLLVALYRFQPPLAVKLGAVAVVGGLLTLQLLVHTPASPARRLTFAALVGVSLAEVALSLHFWPQEGAFTAVFLLVGFYLGTGMLQSYLWQRLSPWVAVEFLGVGVISFSVLYTFQAWRLG